MKDMPDNDTIKILITIAEIKKDITYIKQNIEEIKSNEIRRKNYLYAILGSVIISITSVVLSLIHL
jgi:hypothetical protein